MNRIDRESDIFGIRDYYSDIGIWPKMPRYIDPRGWLNNFEAGLDRQIATALLDSFIFFDETQTEEMVLSAVHSISGEIEAERPADYPVGAAWTAYLGNLYITFPTDRSADPTGSGHHFIRILRKKLEFPLESLHEPRDLVRKLYLASDRVNLLIVDDFAGTGTQFITGWQKDFEIYPGVSSSLQKLSEDDRFLSVYYTPAICTASAIRRMNLEAPAVRIRPAHVLPDSYSATSPQTSLVPPTMRQHLEGFLRKYANRAGYEADQMYGFDNSGLAIAFHDSIPDNTLPIFYGQNATWNPLRKRRI